MSESSWDKEHANLKNKTHDIQGGEKKVMKKSLKVLASATLAFSMFASVAMAAETATPVAPTAVTTAAVKTAADFTDLATATPAQIVAINALLAKGYMEGETATTFNITGNMNRAQAAKLVAKIFGLTVGTETTSTFSDVDGTDASIAWSIPFIEAAKKAGIIDGMTDTTFAPKENVTIGQLAALLVKGFGKGAAVQATTPWYDGYLAVVKAAGIELGTDGAKLATRADLVVGSYAADLAVEAAKKVSVESVKATAANKITVQFNKAVDTAATKFEVNLGFVPQDVTVAFSEDKKSAVLTSEAAFVAGTYTVNVTGIDTAVKTAEVKIEAQKLVSFSVATENLTAVASQSLKYVALDQYGEKFDIATSNFTINVYNATNNEPATAATATAANTYTITENALKFDKDDTVVLSMTHNTTGLTVSKTYKVVAASAIDSIELSAPAPKADTTRITVGDATDALILPISLKDQYGQAVSLVAPTDVLFVSSNNTIVDPASFTVNGDGKLTFRTGATAGNVTITAISKTTGKSSTITFEVFATAALKTVTLAQPTGLVVANEATTVAYQGLDTYGAAKKLASATDLVWFSTNSAAVDVTTDIAVDANGKLTIKPKATATGTTVVSAFLGGVKQGEISLDVKAVAVATKITKLSDTAITNFAKTNGTYTYTNADFVVVDQYNRVITTANLTGSITDVTVKDATATVLNPGAGAAITSGGTVGTKTLVATYTQGAIVLTKEFTANVVADTAVVGYKLADVASLNLYQGSYADFAAANAAGYGQTITIQYGLDSANAKIALATADLASFLTVTTNSAVVTVNPATGQVFATSGAANASTATVTVYKNGVKIGEYNYVVSTGTPVLTNLVITGTTTLDSVTTTVNGNTLVTKSTNQYGKTIATPLAGTWFTSNAAVATVNPTTGLITKVAGGTATVTFVSTNGVVATIAVTVN